MLCNRTTKTPRLYGDYARRDKGVGNFNFFSSKADHLALLHSCTEGHFLGTSKEGIDLNFGQKLCIDSLRAN
jgi:hypothetical protein